MSKATKRKHVTKEVLDEFVLPDEIKQIVRVRKKSSIYIFFNTAMSITFSLILFNLQIKDSL